ncbi:MAG: hypothetical protein M5U08_12840 [Burkholderiales bacterium]|nr:hypothetical protein [Burkholderiales bacterium]
MRSVSCDGVESISSSHHARSSMPRLISAATNCLRASGVIARSSRGGTMGSLTHAGGGVRASRSVPASKRSMPCSRESAAYSATSAADAPKPARFSR